MRPSEILSRLRVFLLALSAVIFAGTLLELWFVGHREDAVQWLAYVIGGMGLLMTLAVLVSRRPVSVLVLRVVMLLAIAGSLFGIYQHVANNVAFEREIQPNATTKQLIWKGVSGANPLLAPAMLALAGLLSLAGTYKYGADSEF